MAYQLLEIVDGELVACLECGPHRELNMTAASWVTIYKQDACVSLPLSAFGVVPQLAVPGSRLGMHLDNGRVLVDPVADADGLFRGSLVLRNGGNVLRSSHPEPTRHQLCLTLAELRSLGRMVSVLCAYDEAFWLGLVQLSSLGGRRNKHTLTPEQTFGFSGDLHACEFTAVGQLTLEPFRSTQCECDVGARTASAKTWADKARLRLTRKNAEALLEFNETELADGVVPRAGRVFRLNDERAVGIWPTQAYFPSADVDDGDDKAEKTVEDACALVPFTQPEWHWLCACLQLYLAAGDYLLRRERATAMQQAEQTVAPATPVKETDVFPVTKASASAENLCAGCNKPFTRKADLNRHSKLDLCFLRQRRRARRAADAALAEPSTCLGCMHSFATRGSLARHTRRGVCAAVPRADDCAASRCEPIQEGAASLRERHPTLAALLEAPPLQLVVTD